LLSIRDRVWVPSWQPTQSVFAPPTGDPSAGLWQEAQSFRYLECAPDWIRKALSGWAPPVAGSQADVVWQPMQSPVLGCIAAVGRCDS
jgi:hypothetical protein